jgi:hypothetical protein
MIAMISSHRVPLIAAITITQWLPQGISLGIPMITGCLQACGLNDQVCVTDCQVCVERHHCKRVDESHCKMCAAEVAAESEDVSSGNLRNSGSDKKMRDLVLDSGGVPLIRDGVQNLLLRAQADEISEKRHLRRARNDVLRAQRQSDWATRQRHEETSDLRDATHTLRDARKDLHEWREQEKDKLKDLKAADRKDHGLKLRGLKKSNRTKQAELDAKWIEGGLLEEIDQERTDVNDAVADHRLAVVAGRLSRKELKKAKRQFLRTASIYHESEKRVRRLIRKLRRLSIKLQASPKTTEKIVGPDKSQAEPLASRGISAVVLLLPVFFVAHF